MHLYLIRHGQSYVNLKDWDGGNQDTGLTELGHRQAAALGAWLPGELPAVDVLYASTMPVSYTHLTLPTSDLV